MPDPSKDDLFAWFDRKLGYGWKAKIAEAMGVTRESVTKTKPGTPTFGALCAIRDLLAVIPIEEWPDRFREIRSLALLQAYKESRNDPTPDRG